MCRFRWYRRTCWWWTADLLRGRKVRIGVTEAWSVRVQRVMRALGWPVQLMAERLGLKSEGAVVRLLRGGRPAVEVLLRLQSIERLYAGEIEKQRARPGRTVRKAYLWPPRWVGCRQRWWVERRENKPPSRPADLQMLGADRTDPAVILTGRLDPRLYPGRVLRIVDWTVEGRRRYAADQENAARERDAARKAGKRSVGGKRAEGTV